MKNLNNLNKNERITFFFVLFGVFLLFCILGFLIFQYNKTKENILTQQDLTGTGVQLENNYKIEVSDKETPEKILYIPNLTNMLNKKLATGVEAIGRGANLNKLDNVSGAGNITKQYAYDLTNEKSGSKTISTNVIFYTDNTDNILKISFKGDITSLGYANISFKDIINNEKIVDKSLKEAGLENIEHTNSLPLDNTKYTTYASDGTTATNLTYNFTGISYKNDSKYTWSTSILYDYTKANESGNLADTLRSLTITVE